MPTKPYRPTRLDCKRVFQNSSCRRVSTEHSLSQLRRAKPIRAAVQQRHLSVWPYSQHQLVCILQSLLADSVFSSDFSASLTFPELFTSRTTVSPPAVPSPRSIDMDLRDTIQKSFLADRADLLQTGKYSDLTVLASKKYKLHRNILCQHSAVFEVACSFASKAASFSAVPFAQSSASDASYENGRENDDEDDGEDNVAAPKPLAKLDTADAGTIDLRREDPIAVDCMVQFLYKLDYDPQTVSTAGTAYSETKISDILLFVHVLVYKLAEVYEVDHLKSLALRKFSQVMSQDSISVDDLVRAAMEAYDEMHECFGGIRAALVAGFHKHRKVLLATAQAKDLLHSNGVIAFDLLQYLDANPFS